VTTGAGATAPPSFLLLALQPNAEVGWRIVGRYPDYEAAEQARVADTLVQLERSDGWLVLCEHLIIGPNPDGSIGCWPHLASLGADPTSDRVPAPYDRADWEQWLDSGRRPTD
jgi:hypothetical protein